MLKKDTKVETWHLRGKWVPMSSNFDLQEHGVREESAKLANELHEFLIFPSRRTKAKGIEAT